MAVDTEFTITYVNPAGASVVGMTPDEVTGRKCFDLFKTLHCKTEKCACGQAMKTDRVVSEDTIARPKEGVILPIKYTGAPIKDAKGNVKGALEFAQDVTRKDEVEKLVSDASQQVADLVVDSKKHMEQVQTDMHKMNQAIDQEVFQLDESETTIREMLASTNEMRSVTERVSDLAGTVAKEAENGQKAGAEEGGKIAGHQSFDAAEQWHGSQPGGAEPVYRHPCFGGLSRISRSHHVSRDRLWLCINSAAGTPC